MIRSTMALALLAVACRPAAAPGCDKDTDCKGERICMQRACMYPPTSVRAPDPGVRPPDMAGPGPDPAGPAPTAGPPLTPPPPTPPPAGPPVVPPPAPTTPMPPPGSVHSGDGDPKGRCGCARNDLMCNMRCAQRDNPAAPRFPQPPVPPPRTPGF